MPILILSLLSPLVGLLRNCTASDWKGMEGDLLEPPKSFTLIRPTLTLRPVPLSLLFNAGFNNFLVGNRFGFLKLGLWCKDRVLWLELTSTWEC